MKLNKETKINLIIAGVILAILFMGYIYYTSGPKISTNGYSKITATPDLISININVEGRGTNSSDSQSNAFVISEKLLTALEELGIDSDDVELSAYYTYEEKDWRTGVSKGYLTTQQFIVRLNDFSESFNIIQTATDSGALVYGINFELSSDKENEYKAVALKEASQDARVKAEAVANGFGSGVGRLVSVQTKDFYYAPYPYYAREDEGVAVGNEDAEKAFLQLDASSPKDLEVSASVTATYTLTRF